MFEPLRRSIGLRLARFHFRKHHDVVMSFTGAVAGGNRALLILPLRPCVQSTAPVIALLRAQYPDERITIVTDEHDSTVAGLLPRSEILRLGLASITRYFLPTADVVQRVGGGNYDVAFDLNLDFLLPSGYICKASRARVRVGFARAGADMFYNFQMQPDGARGSDELYGRLAACVQMFAGSKRK